MFEIIYSRIRPIINCWLQFSDVCAAQFSSKFCTADLMHANKEFDLLQSAFHYFESHEGKNKSDTIGSIVKAAFDRGLLKDKSRQVVSVDDVAKITKENLNEKTKKFDFVDIETFPEVKRLTERDELAIDGITLVHSMVVRNDNLHIKEISCINCNVSSLCEDCLSDVAATPEYIKTADSESDADIDDEDQSILSPNRDIEDLIGHSDIEEEESSADEEDMESLIPGDIVWGRHGRVWYPAKVVDINEIPANVAQILGRAVKNKIVVKWWNEDNYSALPESKVEPLGRNKVDEFRANVSKTISMNYHLAVAEVIDCEQ